MQVSRTDCAGHVISEPIDNSNIHGGRHDDGVASGGDPQALKTPGEGVWRHATDSNYAFRFKYFTFNTQNIPTGWVIDSGEITVDATGETNTGSATVEIHNPSGILVATGCAEVAGTRFNL